MTQLPLVKRKIATYSIRQITFGFTALDKDAEVLRQFGKILPKLNGFAEYFLFLFSKLFNLQIVYDYDFSLDIRYDMQDVLDYINSYNTSES